MTAQKKSPAARKTARKTSKKKAAVKKPAVEKVAAGAAEAERQLTCFVVIGFGRKTDYATGRVLDLDKTYEQLIRPAFDRVDVNAFRAIDANLTGSIDSIMYRWIFEADIVVADLSTLNANVFYELGVRHAQKPNTTIIIAESVLMSKIPFDLSSFVIHQYHHGGDDIAPEEQERFVAHLASIQQGIIDSHRAARELDPDAPLEGDSPVYTFLPNMTAPSFEGTTKLVPPPYVAPELRKKDAEEGESLGSIIDAAEGAKGRKDFPEAIRLFEKAIETELASKPPSDQEKKPDVFLAQRLALVTYKNGETKDADGNIDKDRAIAALGEAEQVLERYCAPKISTDPETLGLSGAINKRLFDLTGDLEYLDRAIAFYERGFFVKQDYYNGINVAFMYTVRSLLLEDRFEAIVSYGHANMIRRKVGEICQEIIDDEEFHSRADRDWVLMTLAEVYQGLGRTADEERLTRRIEAEADPFSMDSYTSQKAKLAEAIEEFQRKVRPGDLAAAPASEEAPARGEAQPPAEPAASKEGVDGETTHEPTVSRLAASGPRAAALGGHPITIDAGVADRPIKAVEIHCKIEYD